MYLEKDKLAKTVTEETDIIIYPFFNPDEDFNSKADIDIYDDELRYTLFFNKKEIGQFSCEGCLSFMTLDDFVKSFEDHENFDSLDEYLEDMYFESFILKKFKGTIKYTVTVDNDTYEDIFIYIEGEGELEKMKEDFDYSNKNFLKSV
jgi:hypothetical protein